MIRKLLLSTVLAAGIVGSTGVAAFAQDQREAEIIGLHQLCDHGDRKACIRFGMMIQQNRERMGEWRRTHPEWFWWER